MRLKDKTAIVTGSGSGIGKKIAETFAREGANVVVIVIADFNLEAATAVAKAIGKNAIAVNMDVSNEDQVESGIAKAISSFGSIDILISNAGSQFIAPIDELPFSKWKKLLAIHLDGAFLTTRACFKNM